jgi:hypothetical protein
VILKIAIASMMVPNEVPLHKEVLCPIGDALLGSKLKGSRCCLQRRSNGWWTRSQEAALIPLLMKLQELVLVSAE